MKKSRISVYAVILVSMLLLCSCSSNSDDSMVDYGMGSIVFSIELPDDALRETSSSGAAAYYKASRAPWCEEYGIASVEAKVYDENNTLIASGGPWACALGEGIIYNVKAGNNRTVVIFLRDNNGDIRYQGEKSEIYVPAGGITNAGVITVEIVPEDILTAADDSATVNRDGEVVIPVLENDYNPQGEGVNVSILTTPSHGSAVLNTDGSIRYTHTDIENNATSDSFDYQISDNDGNVSIATVTITIIPASEVNQVPVANPDYAMVTLGGAVAIDVLDNDYDPDGDELSMPEPVSGSGPANGSAALSANGIFVYTHNGTETESDRFEYQINDGRGGTATAAVEIDVILNPDENKAPVLDQGSVNPPTGYGGDTFTYTVHYYDEDGHPPSHIEVIINGTGYGMTWFSGESYDGIYMREVELLEDGFYSYEISCSDGYGGDAVITGEGPTVLVAENHDPVAVADTALVFKGGTVFIPVLDNDYDTDGDILSMPELVSGSGPANGSATLSANGIFVYTHNGTETESDRFEYQINDGRGGTATAAVEIDVNLNPDENHDPVLDQGSVNPPTGNGGDTFTYTVHYYDEDGHPPSHIEVIINGTGYGMNWFSGESYNGTYMREIELLEDGFYSYEISCSDGYEGDAFITGEGPTVLVPENHDPVAVADTALVFKGGTVFIPVLDNDYDPDGDILSMPEPVSGSGPANGSVTLDSNGIFVYTHNGTETESDRFEYQINDGRGGTATAAVEIDVTLNPDENHDPVLDQGSVNPPTGNGGDTFTYTVHYYDEDGHPPSHIEVIINGTGYGMNWFSGESYNGTYMREVELLEDGFYSYEISCSDGYEGDAVITGEGPTVLVPENQTPVAVADTASVLKGGTVFISVLDNDYDPEGELLSINPELINEPAKGEVVLLGGRGFVYTHTATDKETDSFEYEVSDPSGLSDTAVVSISIEAPGPDDNNPPVLTDGGVSPEAGKEGDTFTYTVHYKDLDGDVPSSGGFIVVFIDGKEYAMTLLSGLPEDGIYTCGSSPEEPLLAGIEHDYVFLCSDGNGGYAVFAGKGPRVVDTAYYVAPPEFGNDGNTGSINDPFATIAHAIEVALKNQETSVVINIAAGEYKENLTLTAGESLIGGWSVDFITRQDFLSGGIENGSATVIDGSNARCIRIITEDSLEDGIISGVTLTNGNAGDCSVGGSALYIGLCSPQITFCAFVGNTTESDNNIYGGAVYIDNGSPMISRCLFSDNSAEGPHIKQGGAIYSNYSQPVIERCMFINNHAGCNMGAGGAIYNHESDARIIDCIFSQNSTGGYYSYGGAVYNESSDPEIINCIFDRNTVSGSYLSYGGAVYNRLSSPVITNCSFSLNQADIECSRSRGGAVYIDAGSSPTVTNTILWGDSAGLENEIYIEDGASPVINSCYEYDPLFVDPSSGDLHLQYDSPCINAGTNDAPLLPAADFEGDLRQGTVDIGADEYVSGSVQ